MSVCEDHDFNEEGILNADIKIDLIDYLNDDPESQHKWDPNEIYISSIEEESSSGNAPHEQDVDEDEE